MKVTVTHDDGTTIEITDGVQIAYDVAYNSLDWGSGFLDLEEVEALAQLAEACRFPSFEEALQWAQAERERQERAQRAAEESHRRAQEQLAVQAQRQRVQDRGIWLP